MLEHRNVLNFMAGMDERIERTGDASPSGWAVTSLSFDISVLELLWTLARASRSSSAATSVHPPRPRRAAAPRRHGF